MKILITGSRGLVGSRFVQLYPKKENLITPTHSELDITNPEQVKNYISKIQPEIILNLAGYINVSEGENQRGDRVGPAWKINTDGINNILSAIDPQKTYLLQISTDLVFSGSASDPGPYEENHLPETDSSKVTWYGFTKAEGERLVHQSFGAKTAILRMIYPVRAKFARPDYLRKPLQLFDQGKLYPLFTDQQVSITFIDEACGAINKILSTRIAGIFHAGSSDTGTPFELLSYLFKKTRGYKGELKTHSLDDFLKTVQNPVRYPKFGGLKVEETERKLGMKFSTWKQIIDQLAVQGLS